MLTAGGNITLSFSSRLHYQARRMCPPGLAKPKFTLHSYNQLVIKPEREREKQHKIDQNSGPQNDFIMWNPTDS